MTENWPDGARWRQGVVVAATDLAAVGFTDALAGKFAVVCMHDCDVTRGAGRVPEVEFLTADDADENGNLRHGKSHRSLQVPWNGRFLQIEARPKVLIAKRLLTDIPDDKLSRLSDDDRRVLRDWLARGYSRAAFPDKFGARLKSAKLDGKLDRQLKPVGRDLIAVLVDLPEMGEELDDQTPYTPELFLLHPAGLEEQRLAAIREAAEAITAAWENDGYPLLELKRCHVISATQLSYDELSRLHRLDLDRLSHSQGDDLLLRE